jgi:hypothetical protein
MVDNPIHQCLADLDRIPFHGKEQIHRGLGDLGNRMEIEGNDDRQSPHPEAIDLDSNSSISYELEQACATMIPRPFVYHVYVCYNYGTTRTVGKKVLQISWVVCRSSRYSI